MKAVLVKQKVMWKQDGWRASFKLRFVSLGTGDLSGGNVKCSYAASPSFLIPDSGFVQLKKE